MSVAAPADLSPLERLESDWGLWLATLFPSYLTAPWAPHHVAFWEWVWAIAPGVAPLPMVNIWPRGGAKTASSQLAVSALGATGRRRYGLLVSDTQDQADTNLAAGVQPLLESDRLPVFYPDMATRAVGKYGPKAWRHNRLQTSSGFAVDAIGLDKAVRGVKIEEQRPDLIILDDIDAIHDTPRETQRKVDTITKSILPAGSDDVAVLAIQNLIHPQGVFARLAGVAEVPADFLQRRILNGPIPALYDFDYRQDVDGFYTISGVPSWKGQDLVRCQTMVDTEGIWAFCAEAQHDVDKVEGAEIDQTMINTARRTDAEIPGGSWHSLRRRLVMIDPSFSGRPGADECGITVGGVGADNHGYLLADLSGRMGTHDWARTAVQAFIDWDCHGIGYESNMAPEVVIDTLLTASNELGLPFPPKLIDVRAGRGQTKVVRLEAVSPLYQSFRVHHVGVFPKLETQLVRWTPDDLYSPDRLDSCVHLWSAAMLHVASVRRPMRARVPQMQLPKAGALDRSRRWVTA